MLKEINSNNFCNLYSQHIVNDFSDDQRPPYDIIKKNIETGYSEGFIYVLDNKEMAYAINTISDNKVVISVFAVFNSFRNSGIGTSFLVELLDYYSDKKIIIVEVDKPEQAKTTEEKVVCEKRISFYERAGFIIHKDIEYSIFGIDFYLMTYSKDKLEKKDVIESMKAVYKQTLNNIIIK